MYYGHFGLTQPPFRITPNTEFFFGGGNRGPILEALIYAVSQGEGVVKVSGEVGSGKTMLCNMLQARLPDNVETIYLANPSVPPDEILHAIAFEMQLGVDRRASRLEVMQAINDRLVKLHAEGKRAVAFVEESQGIPAATLEEIRLLSNLETGQDKLLQIVLFGQPELDDHLRRSDMRPLRERITQSFRLEPLNTGEIREYLMFRMRTAGYRGPDLFPPSVVKRIARASEGLTRRVNLIADKALLAAFSENTHTIRPRHVDTAVRDSEFSQPRSTAFNPRYAWATALILTGVMIGAAAYALIQHHGDAQPGADSDPKPGTPRLAAVPREDQAPKNSELPISPASVNVPAKENKKKIDKTDSYRTDIPSNGTTDENMAETVASAAATTTHSATAASNENGKTDQDAGVNVVRQRLAATRSWLATARDATVSIQLMGTDSEAQLGDELNTLSQVVEMNRIFVYRTMAKQKPSITVLYGSYGSFREAQEALAKLPAALKANRPILRTVQGIRTEIEQYHTF